MNRNEYLAALRGALSGLPDEERASALRYYEEYLDDAGPENEARAIEELGSPQRVAAQILADYRELTTVPGAKNASQSENGSASSSQTTPKRGWRGINPWLLLVLVLLAIPIGVPLAAGVAGVIVSLLAAAVCIVLGVAVVAVALPLCLLLGGGALIVFSFFVWWNPPSAVVTLGCGLACLALGVLSALLMFKLCTLFIPPIFRGFVAILRWPFDRIRGVKR